MPFDHGTIDDSLRIGILVKGKSYSPDKFGLRKEVWKLIIEDELRPYRKHIHIPCEDYFNQLVDYHFIKPTKKKNCYFLSVHFSPYIDSEWNKRIWEKKLAKVQIL